MLAWPHSGFHVHHSVRLEADDALGMLQLARRCVGIPGYCDDFAAWLADAFLDKSVDPAPVTAKVREILAA